MLSCPAEGCKFKTNSDRALTVHLGKCKRAATGLASVADDAEQHDADHRRAKRRRIAESPEHLEVIPEVEGPMDIDIEVRPINDGSENRYLTFAIVLSG